MSNLVCDARIKLTSPETSGARAAGKKELSQQLLSHQFRFCRQPSAIYAVLIKYKGNARAKHDAGGAFTFQTAYFSAKLIFLSNFHRH
jgi:hypothetical protein